MVREELLRYQHHKPCSTCSGTRLNESARNVKIDGTTYSYQTTSTASTYDAIEIASQLILKICGGKSSKFVISGKNRKKNNWPTKRKFYFRN